MLTKSTLKSADYTRRKGMLCIFLLLIYRQDFCQGRMKSIALKEESIYERC